MNWKGGYAKEVKAHAETKKLVEALTLAAENSEKNMWSAQRLTQVERVRYEEAERQRVAVAAKVDGLEKSNVCLRAERDLLLKLLKNEALDGH